MTPERIAAAASIAARLGGDGELAAAAAALLPPVFMSWSAVELGMHLARLTK